MTKTAELTPEDLADPPAVQPPARPVTAPKSRSQERVETTIEELLDGEDVPKAAMLAAILLVADQIRSSSRRDAKALVLRIEQLQGTVGRLADDSREIKALLAESVKLARDSADREERIVKGLRALWDQNNR